MSVWLTPDLKPFVGATYFPEQRFISILNTLAEKWTSDRQEVVIMVSTLINCRVVPRQ